MLQARQVTYLLSFVLACCPVTDEPVNAKYPCVCNAQIVQKGPAFGSLEVGKDDLRRIIGPQGSVIKGLEADSNSRLSIDNAGLVHIYSPTKNDYQTAVASIEGITGASIKVSS